MHHRLFMFYNFFKTLFKIINPNINFCPVWRVFLKKKIFLLGECGFFVSDVTNGGLLGHLGPLCLALGANR